MKRSFSNLASVVGFTALGIAAIVFGESDDAPGLVLLGLLFVAGAIAFWFKPALLSPARLAGFVIGAMALTAIGAFIAGWLEDSF